MSQNASPKSRAPKEPVSSASRDAVWIMSDGFAPEQLRAVVERLERDGHACATFTRGADLKSVFTNSRVKLVLLSSAEGELSSLLEEVRCRPATVPELPTLLYLRQSQFDAEHLPTEVDDFLHEPVNLADLSLRVRRLLGRAAEKQAELEQVKGNLTSHFGMRQFIGRAPAFLATIEKLPRVASCDAPVLLSGETGTGKEMCARAIHYLSPRAGRPFIPINCGSIPSELFESEMFGHEAGAFTDARRPRKGLIAEAEGGTLFLDEVDSLPPAAQVKLLRFLQDRQYRPLGASQFRQANTRILAASNQNLLSKVHAGLFREDLYYRLKVITLHLPRLSERREDILPIAAHFLRTGAAEYNREAERFSQDAIQKMNSHNWPGNVRELENTVRQAVIMSDGPVLRARDLHFPTDTPHAAHAAVEADAADAFLEPAQQSYIHESFKAAKARVVDSFERSYLTEAVAACDGNISKAARLSKKDRRSFFELLRKHNLTNSELAAQFAQAF